jgi:hypothetical protein
MAEANGETPSKVVIHSDDTITVQREAPKDATTDQPNVLDDTITVQPNASGGVEGADDAVDVRNLTRNDSNLPQLSQRVTWERGIVKRAPWGGIVALFLVILCVAACATILFVSHGQLTARWRVQPTVWLALLSVVANALLRSALSVGVTIAWWRKALNGGTLNDLHRYWNFGGSLWASLTSWKDINIIAIASISVTLAALDGPLLQRATSVNTEVAQAPVNVSVQISTQLPNGFTGHHAELGGGIAFLKYPFTRVMLDYSNRVPLTANTLNCNGSCTLTVQGVGLSPECSIKTSPIDLGAKVFVPNSSLLLPTAYDKHIVFSTNFTFEGGETTTIVMTSTYSNSTQNGLRSCPGMLTIKNCTLRPAIVEYPFRIDDSGARILLNTTAYPQVVSYIAYPDLLFADSTFGGIFLAAQQIFTSQANISFELSKVWNFASSGSLANRYLQLDQYSSNIIYMNCNLTFEDPTSDIFLALNEIMFRSALAAANATDIQNVQAMQTTTNVVFKLQYQYLMGAIAVMLLSVAAIISILNGWWVLGRSTSLSPLEVAKAFNAPLLHSCQSSNAPIDDLLKEIGDRRIKYGEVRFRIEDGSVMLVVEDDSGKDQYFERLEIADPLVVSHI